MTTVIDLIESNTFEAGKIVKAHGVTGKLVIRLDRPAGEIVDFPEWLFIRIDGGPVPFEVLEESVFQKDTAHIVVGLDGVNAPEKATKFIGFSCFLEGKWEDWFEGETSEGESLTGFTVTDETSGYTGIVTGFEDIPGNPLLEININGKKTLVPLNAGFILTTDVKKRKILLRLPDGLIDL